VDGIACVYIICVCRLRRALDGGWSAVSRLPRATNGRWTRRRMETLTVIHRHHHHHHNYLFASKHKISTSIQESRGRLPERARGRCRISPPRFLAECCKRQLNQVNLVLLYFRLSAFSDLYWVCLSVFSRTVLFVSISQVIGCEDRLRNDYTVSSGALNSTQTKPSQRGTNTHQCWPPLQLRDIIQVHKCTKNINKKKNTASHHHHHRHF